MNQGDKYGKPVIHYTQHSENLRGLAMSTFTHRLPIKYITDARKTCPGCAGCLSGLEHWQLMMEGGQENVCNSVAVWAHLEHEVVDHTVEAGPLEVEGLAGLAGTLLTCGHIRQGHVLKQVVCALRLRP